jgi:hypothetical protein
MNGPAPVPAWLAAIRAAADEAHDRDPGKPPTPEVANRIRRILWPPLHACARNAHRVRHFSPRGEAECLASRYIWRFNGVFQGPRRIAERRGATGAESSPGEVRDP